VAVVATCGNTPDQQPDTRLVTHVELARLHHELFATRTPVNHLATSLTRVPETAQPADIPNAEPRGARSPSRRNHRLPPAAAADTPAVPAARFPPQATMIPKPHSRVIDLDWLLRYLFSPREHGQHRDPHIITAWAYATTGDIIELQPPLNAAGR
jgi:hypothetical protein